MSVQQTPAVGLCCSVCWGPDKLMLPKFPHPILSWPQYKCVHSFLVYAQAAHSQGAARYIYHLRRERRSSSAFTVTSVFKGCTRVCLVFSAVSPRPSVPLPAIGGKGLGEVVWGWGLLEAGWAPIWSQPEPLAFEEWPQLDMHSSCLFGATEPRARSGNCFPVCNWQLPITKGFKVVCIKITDLKFLKYSLPIKTAYILPFELSVLERNTSETFLLDVVRCSYDMEVIATTTSVIWNGVCCFTSVGQSA